MMDFHPLEKIFAPESIAVIGASRTEGSLGKLFLDNLIRYGYQGKIYPVNPKADEISGIPCYPDIPSLPEPIDVAVILVRKDLASDALEQCGKKGIPFAIIITAGFRETGPEGAEREKELVAIARRYGMRLIGPNCMGVFNTEPSVRMNASFSPTQPLPGHVAFISQSGALGVAVLELALRMNLGFSLFVSMGNKADLSDTDFIEYAAQDPNTSVITLYQESVDEPERFRETVSKVSQIKPVLILKAGRTSAGQKAASSHTGALASSDAATQALFDQCGVIRLSNLQELFETSLAFSTQPIPRGKKVAVLTNAGGPAILATDAIDINGLEMAALSDLTKRELKKFLPEEAAVANPVDMIASATHDTYRESVRILLQDPNVDALFVIIVRPPTATTPRRIIQEIHSIMPAERKIPLFFILMAEHDEQSGADLAAELGYPVFDYPESAASALAKMVRFASIRDRKTEPAPALPVNREIVQQILQKAKDEQREHLLDAEVREVLTAYGFPLPRFILARTVQEAIHFQQQLNQPVVLKIESPKILHKSDIGGVKIRLSNPDEITRAWNEIMNNALNHVHPSDIKGILVQEMVSGREVALGMASDPHYGPLIMFGLGGIFVEIFKDVTFRLAPLSRTDAREMIRSIQGYPILAGARGERAVDIVFLEEMLLRLSALVTDHPEIAEMDINPLMMNPDRQLCRAVDARIRIKR